MNTRPGRGGDLARSASAATAKGAVLVGAAVLVGILLLQIVDDGSVDAPSADGATTETTQKRGGGGRGTTTTTEPSQPARDPEQVRVVVLNGGAATGSAAAMSEQLKPKGYTNQGQPGNTDDRIGNAVQCRNGFDREAAALAVAVGEGTVTEPFPATPPAGTEDADCIIIVGGAATTATTG